MRTALLPGVGNPHLDGLRALMALFVVIHHVYLTIEPNPGTPAGCRQRSVPSHSGTSP